MFVHVLLSVAFWHILCSNVFSIEIYYDCELHDSYSRAHDMILALFVTLELCEMVGNSFS